MIAVEIGHKLTTSSSVCIGVPVKNRKLKEGDIMRSGTKSAHSAVYYIGVSIISWEPK